MTDAEYLKLPKMDRLAFIGRAIKLSKTAEKPKAKAIKARTRKAKGADYRAKRSSYCGALQGKFSGFVMR